MFLDLTRAVALNGLVLFDLALTPRGAAMERICPRETLIQAGWGHVELIYIQPQPEANSAHTGGRAVPKTQSGSAAQHATCRLGGREKCWVCNRNTKAMQKQNKTKTTRNSKHCWRIGITSKYTGLQSIDEALSFRLGLALTHAHHILCIHLLYVASFISFITV